MNLRLSTKKRPCLNDCSRRLGEERGICVDGSCRCSDAYAGPDCSIALIPNIEKIFTVKANEVDEQKTKSTCSSSECNSVCTYGGECATKFTCRCFVDSSHGNAYRFDAGDAQQSANEEVTVIVSDKDASIVYDIFDALDQGINHAADMCSGAVGEVSCDNEGSVVELRLSRNDIAAPFPKRVKDLSRLRLLALNNNRIEGKLPEDLCQNLGDLQHLFLYRNRLSGPLPRSLGMCRSLVSLVLYGNMFDGSLPDSMWQLHRLRILDLSFNFIGGTISEQVDELVDVEALYLDHNRLSGSIPSGLSRMWSLQTLRLEDNPEIFLDSQNATGPCLARATAQLLYRGEEFFLQIDSHMRFRKNWDRYLIEQLRACKIRYGASKPILTTYPIGYTLPNTYPKDCVRGTVLYPSRFDETGMLRQSAKRLNDVPKYPVPSPLWASGFSFSDASIIREVPYDPTLHYLFFGEEIFMAARLFLRGWDFFAPPETVLFHLWSRAHRPTFRERTGEQKQALEKEARTRVLRLLTATKTEGEEGDTTARTMHDFETLLGVDFSKRSIIIQGDREEAAETSHLHAEADGGCIAEKAAATLPTSVLQNIFAKLAS
eukprot:g1205.t1